MLRITIEFVPHGIEAQACKIAQMIIANTGGSTSDYAHYEYSLHSQAFGEAASVDYGSRVSNHARQQSVLALCRATLNDWWDDHGRLQAPPPLQQPIRMSALLEENGAVAEYHQGAWRMFHARDPIDCWWVLHSGFPRDRWLGLDEETARQKLLALIKQGQPEAATDKMDR